VQIKYGALNGAEYLAVSTCANNYIYTTLNKGFSLNNVYETCRDLIINTMLGSILINYEEI